MSQIKHVEAAKSSKFLLKNNYLFKSYIFFFGKTKMEFIKIAMNLNQHKEC